MKVVFFLAWLLDKERCCSFVMNMDIRQILIPTRNRSEDLQNSRSQALPLFYPLNSKIGIRILHTVLYTLPMVL